MIDELIGYSAFGLGFLIVMMSIMLVHRYEGTKTMRMTFILLGTAFIFYSIAELLWYLFDAQGIEPYQNWPDLFYVGYFIFAISHVMKTLYFFKIWRIEKVLTDNNKLQIISFVSLTSIIYIIIGHNAEITDLLYGLMFIILSSTLAIITLICVLRVVTTKIGTAWLLIGISIITASFLDIVYYTLELTAGYEYGQYPILDIGWFLTDVLIVIGIIQHRRSI